jgi:hypothetical protein
MFDVAPAPLSVRQPTTPPEFVVATPGPGVGLKLAMFGFGPFAGFLTLTFATIGFMAKLMAEDTGFLKSTTPAAKRSISREKIQNKTSCIGSGGRGF